MNKSPACSLWTPHRVRGDTMRIGDGEALSSFRATTRNPEIPRHGITQYSRTVWHYSTLCHLQSWAPLRMWGDTVRIGGGEALSSFRATTRNPEIPGHGYISGRTSHAALLHPLPPRSWPPRRVRGDTVRITCGVTQSPHRMQSAPLPQKKYTHSLKKYSEIFGLYYKPIYICSINTFQRETI